MLAIKLQAILSARGKTAKSPDDYYAQDNRDGQGEFIGRWDEEKLGPRPTQEEIDAITDAAVEADIQAKAEIRALEESSGFTRKQREFLKASVPAAQALDDQIVAKRNSLLGRKES